MLHSNLKFQVFNLTDEFCDHVIPAKQEHKVQQNKSTITTHGPKRSRYESGGADTNIVGYNRESRGWDVVVVVGGGGGGGARTTQERYHI